MKRKRIIKTVLIVVGVYLVYLFGFYVAKGEYQSPAASASGASSTIQIYDLWTGANNERRIAGQKPLLLDERLNNSAAMKCKDMADKGYWAHNTPSGVEPWELIKSYTGEYEKAAENLADGFSSSKEIIDGWMKSAGHRESILDPKFENVGYAICSRPTGQTIVVQHFIGQ